MTACPTCGRRPSHRVRASMACEICQDPIHDLADEAPALKEEVRWFDVERTAYQKQVKGLEARAEKLEAKVATVSMDEGAQAYLMEEQRDAAQADLTAARETLIVNLSSFQERVREVALERNAAQARAEELEAFRDDVEAIIDAEGPAKLPHRLIDRVHLCATDAADLAAARSDLEEALGLLLSPEKLEGLADWMLKRCDLDNNAHVFTQHMLRERATLTRAFLAKHPAARHPEGGSRG